jgi:hypothetical protein
MSSTAKVIDFNKEINKVTSLKDFKPTNTQVQNDIPPAMVLGFVDEQLKKHIQKGGDGYTIDVNKSINGMVGWSRYSFNYAPIIDGELIHNSPNNTKATLCKSHQQGGKNDFESNSTSNSIYDMLQKGGNPTKMKVNQFDAIQQVGRGLVPLSINSLISLILLIFLHHSMVDGNVDNTKLKTKMKSTLKKGGSDLISTLAPLGRGNLLILASLLLLHHFAVEKPKTKKVLKGGSPLYEQMNKILEPLGLKNGLSQTINQLYEGFQINKKSNKQEGGSVSILKSIIAPLGTNAFIATGILLILKKVLLTNSDSKVKKGGSKKDFDKLVNLLGPLSFNAFANENFVKEIIKMKKNNKKIKESST